MIKSPIKIQEKSMKTEKVINYTKDLKTLYEIRNQKNMLWIFITFYVKKKKISEELIKEVHKKLTKNTYDERIHN